MAPPIDPDEASRKAGTAASTRRQAPILIIVRRPMRSPAVPAAQIATMNTTSARPLAVSASTRLRPAVS
ncbi:hypothetical protein BA062_17775 [Prauserella flavalba]|uniref:Uncharacterized protein n=1 Tax=Prauserella flavalba TaxID=1477506 RepID=A0A318LLG1_9PSEU|nr:hypothetical protein [Prauserella flavalba]PXY34046.1 hypothetical protein BA062_17775 [Prauserella flavalba]